MEGPPARQVTVRRARLDLLTALTGVSFDEAWASRAPGRLGEAPCDFIGKAALIRKKRALGWPRDLADLELLEAPD
jgi:hypothetical protein